MLPTRVYPKLTVDILDSTPDDGNTYELIEGDLLVSRAPSLKHQRAVTNLSAIIWTYLKSNRIGQIFSGVGVIFSSFSGVIPDLVYISNERYKEIAVGDKLQGCPDLVVEVVSPGRENESRDRSLKLQLYGKYGVKEYWIVDPHLLTVEIYAGESFILAATLGYNDQLTSSLLPGFTCSVKEIFDEF
ncbi:MAG: Uma2 family endonuclease [Blastocatellia bacterium]|nr:Uma2 family endonuclease [Blastocatellia bacterium]